jgi:hypothetical protein
MSDLSIGLAIAGVLVIICIVIHSLWTTKTQIGKKGAQNSAFRLILYAFLPIKHRDQASSKQSHLMSKKNGRIKTADEQNSTEQKDKIIEDERIKAANTSGDLHHTIKKSGIPNKLSSDVLNPKLDSIVTIQLHQPVHIHAYMMADFKNGYCGSKPYLVEGHNFKTQVWEHPKHGQQYTSVRLGIQLTNRKGVLNKIEFSELIAKAQHLSDNMEGDMDIPDMLDEIARARRLDTFANIHDLELGFILRSNKSPWDIGFIMENAKAIGFVDSHGTDHMFLPKSGSHYLPLLSLVINETLTPLQATQSHHLESIRLTLEIPKVDPKEGGFQQLWDTAHTLSKRLEAIIVDDDGCPITPTSKNLIEEKLDTLYSALKEQGFSAGSPQACRLFS